MIKSTGPKDDKEKMRAAEQNEKGAVHASTLYSVVQNAGRKAAWVALKPETGRTHQIRIHLSEAGHPLLGERVYVRRFAGPILPAERIMLHAAELGFVHPTTGQELRFESTPPEDFRTRLAALRK